MAITGFVDSYSSGSFFTTTGGFGGIGIGIGGFYFLFCWLGAYEEFSSDISTMILLLLFSLCDIFERDGISVMFTIPLEDCCWIISRWTWEVFPRSVVDLAFTPFVFTSFLCDSANSFAFSWFYRSWAFFKSDSSFLALCSLLRPLTALALVLFWNSRSFYSFSNRRFFAISSCAIAFCSAD
jgi:hypothetical protein